MRRCILLWLAAAAGIWGQTTFPVVIIGSPITLSFGMLGLAAGQTVRLNAVNIVRTPPPVAIAQVPCKVELDLFDAQGNLVKQTVIDNLGFGRSAFVEADRAAINDPASRPAVTGVVKIGSTQSFFCSVTPTLEVYDTATGRTQVILSGASQAPSFIRPLEFEFGR